MGPGQVTNAPGSGRVFEIDWDGDGAIVTKDFAWGAEMAPIAGAWRAVLLARLI